MIEMLKNFALAFIPLFVAIDVIGNVPLFLALTEQMPAPKRRRTGDAATLTAALVAVGFMFLGKAIFRVLGISVSDFKIAGGLILLMWGARELLGFAPNAPEASDDIGVVPLGMPLVVGPATMTTLLVLMDSVGIGYTLVALVINLLIVLVTFRSAEKIGQRVGITGLRATKRIVLLLLMAIAVHMIRLGLQSP
jgi:multiple antibiotic resistance protein